MSRKNYTIDEVIKSLSKKHDVKINRIEGEVLILDGKCTESKNDLGNGSLGKISFLVNYYGFRVFKTDDYKSFKKYNHIK